jgi:hypothetical protein
MHEVQLHTEHGQLISFDKSRWHIESPAYPPLAVFGADQTKQDRIVLSTVFGADQTKHDRIVLPGMTSF